MKSWEFFDYLLENAQIVGFNRMEQNVVYSLKELGVAGSQ